MDKNAIKKFAVWARTELIARVSLKGVEYGITEDNIEDANADSVGGKVLTADEKRQRQALIAEIKDKGYKQVMEEVAYTWFNRFSALRFMEVNGYLPSHVRVFTDEENNFKPQIIAEAIHLDLDGLDMEKVYELKEAEKTEELYKYLLIVQCNALNKILPGMFQKIADYTELLLPDNLLREGSVIQQMIELIPEDDWKDAVQIIGWLYQYYNSEKKDDVFAALKKNVKITKENIPAATQLFTPDWIVRYMVENSLGRLWLEGHPDVKEQLLPTEEEQSAYVAGNRDPEDTKWHYYLEEAEQEPEVQAQLAEIRKEYAALTPDQIKCIDPCCGSGHILAYMFDVLMKIYESCAYTPREAVASIVENNLYGLDIDDRAAQLAYFAVLMKARQYDRRFFSRGIQPHVYAIVESNHVDQFALDYFCNGDAKLTMAMDTIISELHDAKEYGSILTITPQDWSALYERFAEITEDINMSRETALRELLPLVQVAEALAQKYDVVVTNPPYMSSSGMNNKLRKYVKKHFPNTKSDMYAVFIEALNKMQKINALLSMITMQTWMFIGSYEKFRINFLHESAITSLLQLGIKAFEEIGNDVVQTVAFCTRKSTLQNYIGCYHKLTTHNREEKISFFFKREKQYYTKQSEYYLVDGCPIAYWISNELANIFATEKKVGELADAKIGIQTGNNEMFVRFWTEVDRRKIYYSSKKPEEFDTYKWFPYTKGGSFRKWYGNNELVVNWKGRGKEIRDYNNFGSINDEFYYQQSITWGLVSSAGLNFRYILDCSHVIGNGGPMAKAYNIREGLDYYLLGLLNSKVCQYISDMLNPTINMSTGTVSAIPVILQDSIYSTVVNAVKENIILCKKDYDEKEMSIDFLHHPLLDYGNKIEDAFTQWSQQCKERYSIIKKNEELINRLFIIEYGLANELTADIDEKYVSSSIPNQEKAVKSFISYGIGCIFGRYSLDMDGLIYAGGEWDNSKYSSFAVDKDNIIPICDDEYFDDDMVGLFVEFVKTVYGADTLDENLKFIANALGGKGQPKDVIRSYFLNDFYSDHCDMYSVFLAGKRPIYWLFDSGKKNGFKALIYMHRYQPDTIARIRTDYVHEQQARYRTAIADLEQRIANASTGERVKLKKKLTTLQAQDTEIRSYEEKIHHLADQMISIDLDDGVKKNYAIFQDVLAKIK